MKVLFLCAHPDDLEFSVPSLIITLAQMGKDQNRANSELAILNAEKQKKVEKSVCESKKFLFKTKVPSSIKVKVACMTRGEMSSFTSSTKSTLKAAKIRTEELIHSQRMLSGTTPDFLGLFDAYVRISNDVIERVKDYIQKLQPDIIIAPEPYFTWYHHPDHVRTGKIAYFALKRWIQSGRVYKNKQRFPRLFYFQSVWNDWYFPRYPAYSRLIKHALAAHVSQKSLLMGAKLPGSLEKIIHGVKIPGVPFGEALRYQPIQGRDVPGTYRKQFYDLSAVKKIPYYIGKLFFGFGKSGHLLSNKNYDGTLKPNLNYNWD